MKLWNRTALGCLAVVIAAAGAGCGSSTSKTASVASTKSAKTASTPTATTPKKTSTSTQPGAAPSSEPTFGKITLTSSAFKEGGAISSRYTCDGADQSPPLQWTGVPAGTAELFLLVFDLTGSTSSVQWSLAGIPANVDHLSAGTLPAGTVVGINSSGKAAWGGICGEKGLHRVAFLLYALRKKLNLTSGFPPLAARSALKSDTLASGLTLATYQRP